MTKSSYSLKQKKKKYEKNNKIYLPFKNNNIPQNVRRYIEVTGIYKSYILLNHLDFDEIKGKNKIKNEKVIIIFIFLLLFF